MSDLDKLLSNMPGKLSGEITRVSKEYGDALVQFQFFLNELMQSKPADFEVLCFIFSGLIKDSLQRSAGESTMTCH
jgi:hypothetical protein